MAAVQQRRWSQLRLVSAVVLVGAGALLAWPTPATAAVSPASERPAVFRNGTWYLRSALSSGPSTSFGFGVAGDRPVMGDWDRDGLDTIGVFRNGSWYLRNANSSGSSSARFSFGAAGDLPVAGDWDRDGRDSIGVFRNGTFYLRNANSTGASSTRFTFGVAGDLPVAGDWNIDGRDTIGVFRAGAWYLRNANSSGSSSTRFSFGIAGDLPAVWSRSRCSPAYPGVCIPPPPPDLDCGQVAYRNFRVLAPDPHDFDADHDGIGCET